MKEIRVVVLVGNVPGVQHTANARHRQTGEASFTERSTKRQTDFGGTKPMATPAPPSQQQTLRRVMKAVHQQQQGHSTPEQRHQQGRWFVGRPIEQVVPQRCVAKDTTGDPQRTERVRDQVRRPIEPSAAGSGQGRSRHVKEQGNKEVGQEPEQVRDIVVKGNAGLLLLEKGSVPLLLKKGSVPRHCRTLQEDVIGGNKDRISS